MNGNASSTTTFQVAAVRVVVAEFQQVRWDRAAVISPKLRRDVVPARARFAPIAALDEANHVSAVLFEHMPVVRLRPWRLTQPPDEIHRAFHADSAYVYPLGRRRQCARVVPVKVLSEVESYLIAERDKQSVLVEVPRWRPAIPHATDVNDEAAVVGQEALELLGILDEPLHVAINRDPLVGLFLLEG